MARSPQEIAQTATLLASQGREREAEALFERGLAEFPNIARLANSAGNFHFKAGRLERALMLFERALAIDPDLVEAGVNAAITLARMDRFAQASALLRPLEIRASGNAGY